MSDMMADTRVGVYLGRFAPIHYAHINSAKLFMEQMRLDYLFIVPIKCEEQDGYDAHRMEMCRRAFRLEDGVVVSDMALDGKGLLDVLTELSADGRRLLILGGTDFVLNFDKKRDYREILKLCYPVYMRSERDGLIDRMIVEKLSSIYKETGKMFRRLLGDATCISSELVRTRIKNGADISDLVPGEVEKYIREKSLYK